VRTLAIGVAGACNGQGEEKLEHSHSWATLCARRPHFSPSPPSHSGPTLCARRPHFSPSPPSHSGPTLRARRPPHLPPPVSLGQILPPRKRGKRGREKTPAKEKSRRPRSPNARLSHPAYPAHLPGLVWPPAGSRRGLAPLPPAGESPAGRLPRMPTIPKSHQPPASHLPGAALAGCSPQVPQVPQVPDAHTH